MLLLHVQLPSAQKLSFLTNSKLWDEPLADPVIQFKVSISPNVQLLPSSGYVLPSTDSKRCS